MFQALANYAVRGPVQAALLASSVLLLSLLLPPLVVISSALVALIWLRQGSRSGLIAVGLALAVSTVIAMVSGFQPLAPVAVMLSSWLPVIIMAVVLRSTIRLELAIAAGALLVVIGVLIVYLVVKDPAAAWREIIDIIAKTTELRPRNLDDADPEQIKQLLDKTSELMTGFYASTLFVIATLSLLLARSWQARLFNPGGMKREFHELRFGKLISSVGLAFALAAQLTGFEVLNSVAMVLATLFTIQGMAVVHALVDRLGLRTAWLVAIYVLLLMMVPHSLLVVGFIGVTDAWIDYRNRIGNRPRPDDGAA
jgi:MFS family permease